MNNWTTLLYSRIRNYKKSIMNVGFYFLASFIPMVINLFLTPIYSMNMSARDFAIVGYFASFQPIIWPLMLFELNQYYLREYFFRNESERITLRITIFKTFLVLPFLIMGLALIILYTYFYFFNSNSDIPFSPYALLTFLPLALAGIYRLELIDLKVRRNAKGYFKVSIINSLLLILFTVCFVILLKMGAKGKLLGILAPAVIMFVWAFSKRRDALKGKIDWKLLKEAFIFSAPIVIASMLEFFSRGYDKVYLEKFVSVDQLGIYTIGFSIASYLHVFSGAIGETFNPDIYESISKKDNKRAVKFILTQIIIMAVIVVLFMILAKYVIYLLTAGRYVDSTPFARIFSLASLSSMTLGCVTPFIFASKKTYIILTTKIIGSLLSVLTFIILIKNYGLYGAAWGNVLCPFYYSISAIVLYKYNPISLFKRKNKN